MNTGKLSCVVLGLGLMALAAGCETTKPVAATADEVAGVNYPQVEVELQLQDFVRIDAPRVNRDGVLRIVTPIRLASRSKEAWVQYEYQFFDSRGQVVGTPSVRRLLLPSRRQLFIEGVAIDNRAVDWRLFIRSAR